MINKKTFFGLCLLFSLLIIINVSSAALSDDLVGYFTFDINLTYSDTGTDYGVVEGNPTRQTVGCAQGTGCYEGDGTGDAVKIDYFGLIFNNSYKGSVCLWANPDVDGTDVLFGRTNDVDGGESYPALLRYSTGYVHIWNPNTNDVVSIITYPVNEWIHICMVWDDAVMMMYINGTNVVNGTANNPLGTLAMPVRIGAGASSHSAGSTPASSWDGTIDTVTIWNRTITSAEVIQSFNGVNPINNNFTVYSNVNPFNVTINGTAYNTTNARNSIITDYYLNDTELYNISLTNILETKTFINYNISLNGSLTHNYPSLTLTAHENDGQAAINSFNGAIYNIDTLSYVLFNTTGGSHTEYLLIGNYTVTLASSGYATEVFNITVNSSGNSEDTGLWGYNSLFITFKDQSNYITIDLENITIELINEAQNANETTSNGTVYLTNLTSGDYIARYYSDNYTTRFYHFTISDDSSANLTLYMITPTDTYSINITIIDQSAREVEGAVVKALKYNFSSNTYLIQEIGVTNSEGLTRLSLTQNDEYYKFMIEYDNILVKTTNPAYVQSNDITIQVVIGADVGQDYWNFGSISYELVFNNETNNFRYTYTDNNNIASDFCLHVYTNSSTGETIYNSSCSTSSSGTILINILEGIGLTYTAYAFYDDTLLDTDSFTWPDLNTGSAGLVFQIMILLAFLAIGLYEISFMPIGLFAGVLVGRLVNLNGLGWGAIMAFGVTMIIISFLIRRNV